jgi:hypothetical protein
VSLVVLEHVTGNNSLYEDEEEFGESEADIVSSVVLVSSRRMLGWTLMLLLNVLICSSKLYHQSCAN